MRKNNTPGHSPRAGSARARPYSADSTALPPPGPLTQPHKDDPFLTLPLLDRHRRAVGPLQAAESRSPAEIPSPSRREAASWVRRKSRHGRGACALSRPPPWGGRFPAPAIFSRAELPSGWGRLLGLRSSVRESGWRWGALEVRAGEVNLF